MTFTLSPKERRASAPRFIRFSGYLHSVSKRVAGFSTSRANSLENGCVQVEIALLFSLVPPLMKFESNRVDRRRLFEKVTNRLDDDTKMHRVIIDLYFPRNRENVDLLARASISSGSIDLNRFSGGGAFFAAPPSLFYCNLSYCGKLISSSCPPPPAHPFPSKRNRPSFDRRQLRDP